MKNESSLADAKVIEVDTLFIGGGPATLAVLANAYQTSKLEDLVQSNNGLIAYSSQNSQAADS